MKEKPKNKSSNPIKWLIGLGLLLLIACTGFVSFIIYLIKSDVANYVPGNTENLRDKEAVDFVERYFFALPDDINETYFYYYGNWGDFVAYIRFSASPESIGVWLAENDFCFATLIENEPAYLFRGVPSLEWWQANAAARYAVAHQCGNNPYYDLVIDQSNPDLWIVYLSIYKV